MTGSTGKAQRSPGKTDGRVEDGSHKFRKHETEVRCKGRGGRSRRRRSPEGFVLAWARSTIPGARRKTVLGGGDGTEERLRTSRNSTSSLCRRGFERGNSGPFFVKETGFNTYI